MGSQSSPIAVIVHPGSLLAAVSEGIPIAWRDIRSEIAAFPVVHCVEGGMIPASGGSRTLRDMASVHWEAAPEGGTLRAVAFSIAEAHPHSDVTVFGAWGDPVSGCAAAVFDGFLEAGCYPHLHCSVPVYDDSEWQLTPPRIGMLEAIGKWHSCPRRAQSILDAVDAGALDGGCFIYAEAAREFAGRAGKIAAVAGRNGVEHFFLQITQRLGFDGDGVRPTRDIIATQADEGVVNPRIVHFASIDEARAAAEQRGIPTSPQLRLAFSRDARPMSPGDLSSPSESLNHRIAPPSVM